LTCPNSAKSLCDSLISLSAMSPPYGLVEEPSQRCNALRAWGNALGKLNATLVDQIYIEIVARQAIGTAPVEPDVMNI
jgi:hypothetical protein